MPSNACTSGFSIGPRAGAPVTTSSCSATWRTSSCSASRRRRRSARGRPPACSKATRRRRRFAGTCSPRRSTTRASCRLGWLQHLHVRLHDGCELDRDRAHPPRRGSSAPNRRESSDQEVGASRRARRGRALQRGRRIARAPAGRRLDRGPLIRPSSEAGAGEEPLPTIDYRAFLVESVTAPW